MAQQTIGIGTTANDGTGDTIRDAFDKCNDNFTELYTGLTGLLDFKGSTDCSGNPNYPAASKGDFYLVSVAGKIGGAIGVSVEVGDSYFATADNAGGTQAGVGTSWTVIQGNITSYLPLTGGTLTGDLVVPAEAYGVGWDGSNEVPTKNDVYDKIEAVVAGGGYTDEQVRDVIGAALVAGTNITITVNDGADTITIDATSGGGAFTDVKLGSDFTTNSGTAVNVTGFKFTPAANKTYEIEGQFLMRTASNAIGPRPGNSWPTGCTDGVVSWDETASTGTSVLAFGNINASVTDATSGLPDGNSWPARFKATLIMGASPSGDFQITLLSETAGTNVTMKAGSWFKYREM